jgi:Sulfotransferase family
MADPPAAPFIVANPGSGTTLLRMMLDAHPDLAIPPETHFVPDLIERAREIRRANDRKPTGAELAAEIASSRRWADFHLSQAELADRMSGRRGEAGAKAAIRAFYGLYAEAQGKTRWGDKTPDYLRSIRRIGRTLPEARFVHLVRDGRDVALSRRRWRERADGKERSIEAWASQWRRWIATARKQAADVDHYVEIRYEDLVADTEPTLRRVCEFAELDFRPEMLDYHERAAERLGELDRSLPAEGGKGARGAGHRRAKHALTSAPPQEEKVQAWRREMSQDERREFEAEAGDLLVELGYPVEEAVP